MAKTKLTLYVDKEVSEVAKKVANLSGKSISTLVKDYFIEKAKKIEQLKTIDSVNKWVGILDTQKTYKKLREELIAEKLKKYENIS